MIQVGRNVRWCNSSNWALWRSRQAYSFQRRCGRAADVSDAAAARLFADRLSGRWGKPVVVENRPGGDGLVSLDAFVGAHDDHTMWFGPAGTFNVLPYQHDTLPFDPKRDLNPIASVSEVVLAISTPVSMNVETVDQLVAMARAQPGKLNAAAAQGIPLLVVRLHQERRNEIVRVPYRDIMQAPNDLAEVVSRFPRRRLRWCSH